MIRTYTSSDVDDNTGFSRVFWPYASQKAIFPGVIKSLVGLSTRPLLPLLLIVYLNHALSPLSALMSLAESVLISVSACAWRVLVGRRVERGVEDLLSYMGSAGEGPRVLHYRLQFFAVSKREYG